MPQAKQMAVFFYLLIFSLEKICLVTRLKRFHCTVDRLFGWTVQMKCDLSCFIVWSLFCFWISS